MTMVISSNFRFANLLNSVELSRFSYFDTSALLRNNNVLIVGTYLLSFHSGPLSIYESQENFGRRIPSAMYSE